jgi:hypothetical protein
MYEFPARNWTIPVSYHTDFSCLLSQDSLSKTLSFHILQRVVQLFQRERATKRTSKLSEL